ncbi:MAG TPA: hypothetical protein VMT22_13840 [Terriglobales bacterium]|nr:hypothetical protein [Terriglobales bacterium]
MRTNIFSGLKIFLVILSICAITAAGCGGSYDETIAGVTVPVPKAMTKNSEKPAEMSFLGFGAGQASFHGNTDADKIVEFYKKELPARGWQPNMNLRSGGAMLAYSKEGKTLLINVGKSNGDTKLTLTVGGMGK